jgi:hypothetical protein
MQGDINPIIDDRVIRSVCIALAYVAHNIYVQVCMLLRLQSKSATTINYTGMRDMRSDSFINALVHLHMIYMMPVGSLR